MVDIDVLIIGTVNTCNSKCRICPLGYNYPKEAHSMSDELYKKLIDDAAQQRVSTVGFGLFNEPLTDKKIVSRVEYCKEKMPYSNINFSTNGSLLTLDKIRQLKPYVNVFLISFHALDPELYHYFCPNLDQSKVIENIDTLISERIIPHIANLITKKNLGEVEKIKARFPQAEVEAYRIANRCGNVPVFDELALSFERGCCSERTTMDLIVDWDGSILLCCQDFAKELILGNINTQTIEEIMTASIRAKIKNLLKEKRHSEISTCRKCVWENRNSVADATRFKNELEIK